MRENKLAAVYADVGWEIGSANVKSGREKNEILLINIYGPNASLGRIRACQDGAYVGCKNRKLLLLAVRVRYVRLSMV